MKKQSLLTLSVASIILACGLTGGCGKNEQRETPAPAPAPKVSPAAPASAERTSFQQVTSQLDPGGNLYAYLSTEDLLEGLSDKVSRGRQLLQSLPNVNSSQQQNLSKVFDVLTSLIHDSGIEEVSGLGMSAIAREKGFYHSKLIVHHYPGKDSGFGWKLFGQKAHQLDGLNLLSTNTAVALFADVDVAMFWSVLQKQVTKSGFQQATELLNKLPEAFENKTGLNLENTLASLGGEYGFVLTLDESKITRIPLPSGQALELPEPGLMLVLKVKDDMIFDRVDSALGQSPLQVTKVDKPGLKMRTVTVPLPLPIQLRPTVARSGDYLLLATSDSMIEEALAVKAGQRPGAKTTDEFRLLAKDIPEQGNAFGFVSQRLGRTLAKVQGAVLQGNQSAPAGAREFLQTAFAGSATNHSFAVAGITPEGWVRVGNGNQHPAKALVAASVVPAAVIAAVALPAIAKARAKAQKANQ